MSEAEKLDPNAIPREMQERRTLAEQLEQRAAEAFGRGELLVATLHASDLLMLFPNERRYLDRFDEIVLSVDDPLALLPVDGGSVHVATAAGRARVLMMGRRLPEALQLLCRAVDVAPHVPYLHWILRWLQPLIIPTLEWSLLLETAVRTAIAIGVDTPAPPQRNDPRIPNLRAGAEMIKAIREIHPDQRILWYGEVLLRRRLNEAPKTVELAQEAVQRYPSDWGLRTALLNAYRDAERPDEALQQARIALDLDPKELSPLHDAGWAMLDNLRPSDAAELFSELAQRDPDYPGGIASYHWARFCATRSEDAQLALAALRERRWWDAQAVALADEADPPVPYVNVLPAPADASAQASRYFVRELAQVMKHCGVGGNVELTIRSRYLESPSVPMAFDFAMKAIGVQGNLQIDIEELQSPDPRGDKAQVSTPVWRYESTRAFPIYPEGSPDAQAAIAGLARTVFHRDSWGPAAKQIADRFGNDGYHAILSVLTNPPLVPGDEFDAITWVWRCQVATAVVMSHLGGWEGGGARAGIYSMLYGPSDWVSAAAILAMAWRAGDGEAIRAEVESIFEWLRTVIPEKGYTPWEGTLVEAWLGLGHGEAKRNELKSWAQRYHATLGEKNVVRPPERRYGGLSLADYSTFAAHRDRMLARIGQEGLAGRLVALTVDAPEELIALCEEWKVPLRDPRTGAVFPYIREWEEALNANPSLMARFLENKRSHALAHLGVSAEEKAALDNILAGKQDLHQRMAQQQSAQAGLAGGDADPDPTVFPGYPIAKLSDYVGVLKDMQRGDMMGALSRRGLDMAGYTNVAQAWGAKLAADPLLTERFHRMMAG